MLRVNLGQVRVGAVAPFYWGTHGQRGVFSQASDVGAGDEDGGGVEEVVPGAFDGGGGVLAPDGGVWGREEAAVYGLDGGGYVKAVEDGGLVVISSKGSCEARKLCW